MRILFAVAAYWPSKDGVTIITKYLAEGLAARGHEVRVITSAGNSGLQELPEEEIHEGVKIQRMRVETGWPLLLQGRDEHSTPEYYRESIGRFAPDTLVVVSAQTWTLDWLMPYLDRLLCRKVFYCHGYSAWKQEYHPFQYLLRRSIWGFRTEVAARSYFDNLWESLERFDTCIYLSEGNSGYLYSKNYGLTNGMVLPNALDDAFFQEDFCQAVEVKGRKDRDVGPLTFLNVATYNDNKNQELALAAFAKAPISGEARLVFSGFEENPYLVFLRQHAAVSLADQPGKTVEFRVGIPRQEVYDLYREADVYLMTSKTENCPIVLREAAASHMAILSTDAGDASSIGGVSICKDLDEMSLMMGRLAGDRDLLRQKADVSYAWFRENGVRIQDCVDKLEQVLEEDTGEK